jgi:hypothetical protein
MFVRFPGALPQATVKMAFGQNQGPKMRNFEMSEAPRHFLANVSGYDAPHSDQGE